jgi:hypothetical protein
MTRIYSKEQQRNLVDMLREASTPRSSHEEQDRMLCRLVYELSCEVSLIAAEWHRRRRGRLDKQIAVLKKVAQFEKAISNLAQFIAPLRRTYLVRRRGWLDHKGQDRTIKIWVHRTHAEFSDVLFEWGPRLRGDALHVLDHLRRAADLYKTRHGSTPGGLKSEGGKSSSNLASKLFDSFLIVTSLIWFQATGRRSTPNKRSIPRKESIEPTGGYAQFIMAAGNPLIEEFNRSGKTRLSPTWGTYLSKLEKTLRVREIELLGGAPREATAHKPNDDSHLG